MKTAGDCQSTCSRVPGNGLRVRCAGLVTAFAFVAVPAAGQPAPERVVVAPVERRELAVGQTFVGTVHPRRSSTVGSPVSGRVLKRFVTEGDEVAEGDPLIQLRTTDLEIEMAGAEAELRLREEELAELETGTRPEEIAQAKARMLAAEALMHYMQAKLRRTESLHAKRATSEDVLQEDQAAAAGAEQRFQEATAAHELALAGPRHEQIGQARARVAVQQEMVNRLKDDIAEHTVRAPFDGFVTVEHTEVGEWTAVGDPVVELVELRTVDVEVSVLESYRSKIRVGMPARVTLTARPERQWEAAVSAIIPQADMRSRSFPLKIELANEEAEGGLVLQAGMFAQVTLSVGSREPCLTVPKDAVVLGGQTPVVYALAPLPPGQGSGPSPGAPAGGPEPTAVARLVPVTLGTLAGESIEVRGQLEPGDQVVVQGNERLFPGRPLIVLERKPPSGQ